MLDVKRQEHEYVLTLFVAGMSVSSMRAIENLKAILEEHLKNNYSLKIVDINKEPRALTQNDIIACPTLMKHQPAPFKKIVGDLSDKVKVLKGLGLV
ncbi:MAG: circadian clock KaiB family protein [Bacteroidia bacterium]